MRFASGCAVSFCFLVFTSGVFAGTVTITTPTNGSTVASPVHVHATYNGSVPATYMKIWVDHVAGTVQHSTNVFDTTVAMANGSHLIEVQAKDATTATVFTTPTNITVSGATVTVSPLSTSLQPGATQQFTATDSAGLAVTWSATGGTITSGGLYTAGSTAGTFSVTATDSSGSKGTATVSIAASTVTVSPSSASLQPGGTQQFTATDSAGLAVIWSATGGTITSAGLYTAGSTAGTFTVTATDSNSNSGSATVTVGAANTVAIQTPANGSTVASPVHVHATYNGTAPATYMKMWVDGVASTVLHSTNVFDTTVPLANGLHQISVETKDATTAVVYKARVNVTVAGASSLNYTTWKNDNGRTGQQRNETVLTPSNVNPNQFGIKFSTDPLDGAVYTQPLYLSNLSIAGGTHNVVFVGTEHDSVYAFDADKKGSPLWQKSLIPAGATTVPYTLVLGTLRPENGITGTPVIDVSAGTLYVVAETLESGNVVFRLHAMSVTTGNERPGSPVVINAPGWQPMEQMQRPGLLLANGNVYIGFGSQGDHQPYHGWLSAYSATSLVQMAVWNITPSGTAGSIWMAGAAPSVDSSGNIYVSTSNGSWDGTQNYSTSFVKLSPNLTVLDYFTPFDQGTLSRKDWDLGSGGVLLVPDQAGAHPHEVIGCGKGPGVYLVDRDNMGRHQTTSDSQIIQSLTNIVGGTVGTQADNHCFTSPAYWEGNLYFLGNNDVLKSFKLDPVTGKMSSSPTSKGTFVFNFPGGQPVVSSNGSSNGIVWVVDRPTSNPSLHAYSATNLGNELYRSPALTGTPTKWAVPTVINGKVYVGTSRKLWVFGLQ